MIETAEKKRVIYEFGKFVLDPHERVLFADGTAIHLTDKVFEILLLFIRHNGRLLTKDEMMASIWEESFVEESNLARNVSRLRKILNTGDGQLIETLPRRGYRFLANVKEINGETSLLVHRRLRVKIKETEEEAALPPGPGLSMIEGRIRRPRWQRRVLALSATSLAVATLVIMGSFFWNRGTAPSDVLPENGSILLAGDPKVENHPSWTKDGRIRFLRIESDRQTRSLIMNADGTNQTEVNDFAGLEWGFWSPDGSKVLFVKRGDQSVFYLSDANGANEIALPFFGGNFSWAPDSQRIVYQDEDPQDAKNPEIFVYSLETGESRNITNDPAFDGDPSFSPDGKQVVFASLRDGNAEIYLMNADGGDVRRLTDHPAWDSHPVFSPDGTTIAFPSNRESEDSDVYLMSADGGNIRRLTDWKTDEYVEPGCWSPDGTQIAFVSDREGNDDIFVINAEVYRPRLILADSENNIASPTLSPDGIQIVYQAETVGKTGELRVFDTETKRSRVLLETASSDLSPVFAPNGDWIAFHNRIGGNTEICLIKPDGSDLRNLTNNAARDASPTWSPDGTKIGFSSNRGGNSGKFDLYLMNADGNGQHQVYSSNVGMSVSPGWSPDGREVVFANDKENSETGNFEIFKIDLEAAGAEKRLTFRRRAEAYPSFSPDGKQIVFSSNTDGNSEIYLMNADGTGLLRVTRNQAEDTTPQFSKDGTKIIFSSNRGGKFALYEIVFPA